MKKAIYISIVVIVLGGILGNILRYNTRLPEHPADLSAIPLELDAYTGKKLQITDFETDVLKADVTTLRDYTDSSGNTINLFIAYFESQKYGSQIHSPKHCLPGGGWRIEQIMPYKVHLTDHIEREVNLSVISVGDYRALMLYWFESRSGGIRSEYGLKLDLVKNSLLFNPTDAAIVRVTTQIVDNDFDTAVLKTKEFLQIIYPSIQSAIPF